MFSKCSTCSQFQLGETNNCLKYQSNSRSEGKIKVYTKKQLVLFEEFISKINHDRYQPAMQEIQLHIPHVKLLGTNHVGKLVVKLWK